MGELPPLHTPQGPGVPRASRPGLPRVDSSGTSSAPSSRSTIARFTHLLSPGAFPPPSRSPLPSLSFPFLPLPCVRFSPVLSSSLHGPIQVPPRISPLLFPRVSLRFLPFPSPSLRPVLSSSLHFVPHTASRFVLLPLPRVSPRDSSSASVLVFPVAGSVSLFLSFLSASSSFLPLPSPSFRPVLSGSLHSRPLRSPAVFPPTRRSDSSPVLLPDPGFRRPSFGARFLWPAGRAEAPPHHSTGAARATGQVRTLKPYFILPSQSRSPLETEV